MFNPTHAIDLMFLLTFCFYVANQSLSIVYDNVTLKLHFSKYGRDVEWLGFCLTGRCTLEQEWRREREMFDGTDTRTLSSWKRTQQMWSRWASRDFWNFGTPPVKSCSQSLNFISSASMFKHNKLECLSAAIIFSIASLLQVSLGGYYWTKIKT
jgi:hypothetical protein